MLLFIAWAGMWRRGLRFQTTSLRPASLRRVRFDVFLPSFLRRAWMRKSTALFSTSSPQP